MKSPVANYVFAAAVIAATAAFTNPVPSAAQGPLQWRAPETPDDPPAPRAARQDLTARSPGARVAVGPYVSVQVNVDELGRNIVGDAANEPSIAVNPKDPSNIVIGWRQFQ